MNAGELLSKTSAGRDCLVFSVDSLWGEYVITVFCSGQGCCVLK
jgi:hypothetical protein